MANKASKDDTRRMCEEAGRLGLRPERLMLLDRRLHEWTQRENSDTPAIAVRVLRHGCLAFEGAYGPIGPGKEPDSLAADTIFPVCSITKPVVATLAAIMQEEGLIDLNENLRKYIPEFTGDEHSLVKIWHLLSHSSGLIEDDMWKSFGDYVKEKLGLALPGDGASSEAWDEFYAKIREKLGRPQGEGNWSTRRAVMLSLPPAHEPQTHMSYNSFGYQLVLDIINQISRRPIDEYAAEKLFAPLGMKDTHFIFPREKRPRFVQRSPDFCGGDWLNEGILDSQSGGGGLKSTVGDMSRFGQMFLNMGTLEGTRVLSRASVRSMTTDHNPTIPPSVFHKEKFDSYWGLGWNVLKGKKDCTGMLCYPGAYEHCGYGCCKLTVDPEADVVTAFFSVARQDTYECVPNFNNMVIGAIDD